MESSYSNKHGMRTLTMTIEELRIVLEAFMQAKEKPLGVSWRLLVDGPHESCVITNERIVIEGRPFCQ